MGIWAELEMDICVSTDNLGQNDADISTKLSRIGFSMECFTTDFLKIWRTNVRISFLGDRLSSFSLVLTTVGISLNYSCCLKPQVFSRSATREATREATCWW